MTWKTLLLVCAQFVARITDIIDAWSGCEKVIKGPDVDLEVNFASKWSFG